MFFTLNFIILFLLLFPLTGSAIYAHVRLFGFAVYVLIYIMKWILAFCFALLLPNVILCQTQIVNLDANWQFSKQGSAKWYKASVPGTIHTDLLENKLIRDPFFGDNEKKLAWIDSCNWIYQNIFNIAGTLLKQRKIELVFDGLDTYADVYLNGRLILQADNMFLGFSIDVKKILREKNNKLLIIFSSALNKTDSIAKSKKPFVLPDNNRVYARKAQFQFGWDWGPKFIGCGIWKKIFLKGYNPNLSNALETGSIFDRITLVQQTDSIGTSFYFEKYGKPIYAKGANWIPASIFLPSLKKEDYRKILQSAKDAHMNMLRVWGGGIYESDDFYDLCDEMDIMIWQDFMFAGGMYPADEAFMKNVKEEVKYQINRLKEHKCIVLWCGNNEVDEAWHNWGWQNQFKIHGADSIKIWQDYKRLFEDSLKKWVNLYDDKGRAYIASSPKIGWGRAKSYTEGDSHYWGLWWGLADWESFETKTGRFISEYGMQAMPNYNTLLSFTNEKDRFLFSDAVRNHQKATDGFDKLNHYLQKYFIDTTRLDKQNLRQYTYLTQCLQYYILKNSIAVHRSKYPKNMGTLLWQLDDCWPVASWSITDYNRHPKAAWYAVKEAYRDDLLPQKDSVYPKKLSLLKPDIQIVQADYMDNSYCITSNTFAKYVYLYAEGKDIVFSNNYFDLKPGKPVCFSVIDGRKENVRLSDIKVMTLYDAIK
jgi:beta-mannosidase